MTKFKGFATKIEAENLLRTVEMVCCVMTRERKQAR